MPAENPYTDAIFSVMQEYRSFKKSAKDSKKPKLQSKMTPQIDPVDRVLKELGFDLTELRGV